METRQKNKSIAHLTENFIFYKYYKYININKIFHIINYNNFKMLA